VAKAAKSLTRSSKAGAKKGSGASKPKASAKAAPARKPAPAKPKPNPIGSKPVPAKAAKPVKSGNGALKPAAKVKTPPPVPVVMQQAMLNAAVASGKKVKNQAGLSSRELAHFRELLIAKRRELLGDVRSMESEALQAGSEVGNLSNLPDHMADQGTDNYEQEFTLGLMEKDRKLLREIDLALAKIGNGTYGICEGTGKPISKARLEVAPWTRYSVEHARKLETGMFRG
jgi:RNA polymerase-binding protein DksA